MTIVSGGEVPGVSPFGIRRAVRRIIAEPEMHSWLQQCMTFELIENIGTTESRGYGRCLRISTAGTLINTASYRGKDSVPVDPYSRPLSDQLSWIEASQQSGFPPLVDNLMVLDDVHLTIEATDPIASRNQINPGNEWSLLDMSPTTKNNMNMVSTSTTIGVNAGAFGDIPTAGMDFSTTTSRAWSLPDYELFSMGGLVASREPRVVWHVKRSDPKSDPNIARSSFRPDFEAIFGLRADASPKRYSSISVLISLTFVHNTHEITDALADKLAAMPFGGGVFILAGKALKYFSPQGDGGPAPAMTRHSFIMTFVVDWELGVVGAYVPNINNKSAKGDKVAILYTLNSQDDKNAKNNERHNLTAAAARDLLKPKIAPDGNIFDIRLEFRDSSAIGVADIDCHVNGSQSSSCDYDALFPISALASYSEKFSIYQGYPEAKNVPDPRWLPFKRAARITCEREGLIWTAPTGYSRDNVWVVKVDDGKPNQPPPEGFRSIEKIKLPEVPDSYYRSNYTDTADDRSGYFQYVREYIAWRDMIFVVDRKGKSTYRSCFDYLASAAFGDTLSIGISQGNIVMSDDFFKTPLTKDKADKILTKNERKRLDVVLKQFIFGCASAWMFRVRDSVLIFARDEIASFDMPNFSMPDGCTVEVVIESWKTWVERFHKDENNMVNSTDALRSLYSAADIISRTGNERPITGWVMRNSDTPSGPANDSGLWLREPAEMFFQRGF
ncbi:hypothetical protein [Burkholderia cenocepacia]|uniref:hypothetical protein n=1 Tax=Burkholderia cenocepacia TaxID=95486 RepID=UPI00190367F3|nr:hypothetical protein [Burkholderia cenocepacia]MBJ9697681.1 hypothetical protein [Burkholderia cenocepacia]MCA8251441.1 hypothetical protein [Burkholderia multivorans]